jgi:peroxiredoxin
MRQKEHGSVWSFSLGVSLILALFLVFLLPAARCFGTENGKPEPAPDFQLDDLSGKVHRLADHRGSVVVLNFWASWCPECLVEIPSLSAFADHYRGKGVEVISISMDKNEQDLRDFVAKHPIHYPVTIDRNGDVFIRKYFIRGLPATVIVDRQGNIAAKMLGAEDFLSPEFTNRIDQLLGRKN